MAEDQTPFQPQASPSLFGQGRRRRPPNLREQARRVAWGRRWGAIMSAHAKTYKRQGG